MHESEDATSSFIYLNPKYRIRALPPHTDRGVAGANRKHHTIPSRCACAFIDPYLAFLRPWSPLPSTGLSVSVDLGVDVGVDGEDERHHG